MLNRHTVLCYFRGNGYKAHAMPAENSLKGVPEAAAQNITFNKGISKESNSHRPLSCIFQRPEKTGQRPTILAVVFKTCNSRFARILLGNFVDWFLFHGILFNNRFGSFGKDVSKKVNFFEFPGAH